MFIVLNSKAEFLLLLNHCKYTKYDSILYPTILNIKKFEITLKCFHIKLNKNHYGYNCVMIIAPNTISGNQS